MAQVALSFMVFSDPWYNKNMEEKTQDKLSKYIEYIKNNKYNVYSIGAIAILFIIIISMITIILSGNLAKKKSSTPSQNSTQSNSNSPSSIVSNSPSFPPLSIITPEPTEAALIENQTQPQISPKVVAPYTVSEITKYGDNWATMNITNPDVGGGAVIVQKVNGTWTVVLGPGSFFSADSLQSIGAPQQLINSFTTSSPSTAPSSTSPSIQSGD
jgi:hypothetical protein